MDQRRSEFLSRLYAEGVAVDATKVDRLERRRNVEPDTAALLSVLIRSSRAQGVLEIGTSNGYSTVWLADALEDTGGTLTSLEIDPIRTEVARANVEEVGLREQVELLVADAGEYLPTCQEIFDVIFLDAERADYPDYWPHLLRLLRPNGGTLVVDNVVSHAEQMTGFRALVKQEPTVDSVLVPTGAGALLVTRWDLPA